jgi:hypothetical protein
MKRNWIIRWKAAIGTVDKGASEHWANQPGWLIDRFGMHVNPVAEIALYELNCWPVGNWFENSDADVN